MWRGSRRSTCRPACSRSPDASSPTRPWTLASAFHQASIDGAAAARRRGRRRDRQPGAAPSDRTTRRPAGRCIAGCCASSPGCCRPGGVCVINSCSHAQIEQGFWPYHLIPAARALMLRRLMPLDELEAALAQVGIAPRGRFVPVDAVLQGGDYFDPRGPLGAEWRAGDSIWALVERGRACRDAAHAARPRARAASSPPTWPSTTRGGARSARSRCSMASRDDRAAELAPQNRRARAPRSRRRAAGRRP